MKKPLLYNFCRVEPWAIGGYEETRQVIPINSRELEKHLFNALKKFTTLAIKHSI